MASSEGMDIVRTPARTVVIIGVDPCVDIRAIAGAVASQRGELLVLATGWPLTAVQQRVMHDATDAAADLRLPFEARLVYSEAKVEDHLLPDDTVVMPGRVENPVPRPVPSFA
jgi:hypothetical protein